MAKVISIGQPVNDAERQAIAHLRDTLPSTFTILHNFEVRQGAEIFEIDLAILAPHAVYLVDIKGTHGQVDIYGAKWHPAGRQPFHSPLAKLRQLAKIVKALIVDAFPTDANLNRVHVHAAVLMSAPDARVVDHGGLDGGDVTYLNKCLTFFKDKAHVPSSRSDNISALLPKVQQAILGKAGPPSLPQTYRDWQIEERLGGDDNYTEYRARHLLVGQRGNAARLRIYQVDPYTDATERTAARRRISNAYRAVVHMDPHPNILTVREFFTTEHEDRYILVTDDVAGDALRQRISKQDLALTFDQKLAITRDILRALDHAHHFEVIHRNLTPEAILITPEGSARLTAFGYARVGKNRTSTIAGEIVDDLDPLYQAPECYRDPAAASIASDLFAAGLVFYELFVGAKPFASEDEMIERDAIFPSKPSELKPDLPPAFDGWLQTLCAFDPEDRFPSAAVALKELNNSVVPIGKNEPEGESAPKRTAQEQRDYDNLTADQRLGERFVVQQKLGKGSFGVAYKVFDTYSDQVRVLKLITRDRRSVFQRLLREYKILSKLPEHPNVVKVWWADKLPDETPYIVFEFIDGYNVEELIEVDALSLADAVAIARDAAVGLRHIHAHNAYHQDIKPSNLLWTSEGVRLIDFNVASADWDDDPTSGGTRRYIPPDLDLTYDLTSVDKIDRDLYALGITFYECLTGSYPFDDGRPKTKQSPRDPRQFDGCADLSDELVKLLMQMIAPLRAERFTSADALHSALNGIKSYRKPAQIHAVTPVTSSLQLEPTKPNFNPFVSHLLTLYSQSQRSNAGTRGLDAIGEALYVSTRLDDELRPAILNGEFKLVIISGNAGDGKTAFIQKLEKHVEQLNISVQRSANGAHFDYAGRHFLTNYDGSQDEGEVTNQAILEDFFAPFAGNDESDWPANETRLIAINAGRLVDFLTDASDRFARVRQVVEDTLSGTALQSQAIFINLNLRAVVADETESDSIFDRLLQAMKAERFWEPCQSCDLKERCYIHHNARTLIDPVAGPKVIERLKMLYTITHLRGRQHITLRELRSALAFMLAGTRDCDEVHALYTRGGEEARLQILDGFYFNAWMGGEASSNDRLISLLREIDIGRATNPALDRSFAFLSPSARRQSRAAFADRGGYDDRLLEVVFEDLPRFGEAGDRGLTIRTFHTRYVAMLRRRHYFERRDDEWLSMLPFQQAHSFLSLIMTQNEQVLKAETIRLLQAINRGEGLVNPSGLGHRLALQVRRVEKGTIQSYRLFDGNAFRLLLPELGESRRFLEYMPQSLNLHYSSQQPMPGAPQHKAELAINLDVYEMLMRLSNGYQPSTEEVQGYYLSLAVFKNVLSSASYQEVLLTPTGHQFYRIRREPTGQLHLEQVTEGEI